MLSNKNPLSNVVSNDSVLNSTIASLQSPFPNIPTLDEIEILLEKSKNLLIEPEKKLTNNLRQTFSDTDYKSLSGDFYKTLLTIEKIDQFYIPIIKDIEYHDPSSRIPITEIINYCSTTNVLLSKEKLDDMMANVKETGKYTKLKEQYKGFIGFEYAFDQFVDSLKKDDLKLIAFNDILQYIKQNNITNFEPESELMINMSRYFSDKNKKIIKNMEQELQDTKDAFIKLETNEEFMRKFQETADAFNTAINENKIVVALVCMICLTKILKALELCDMLDNTQNNQEQQNNIPQQNNLELIRWQAPINQDIVSQQLTTQELPFNQDNVNAIFNVGLGSLDHNNRITLINALIDRLRNSDLPADRVNIAFDRIVNCNVISAQGELRDLVIRARNQFNLDNNQNQLPNQPRDIELQPINQNNNLNQQPVNQNPNNNLEVANANRNRICNIL